MSAKSVWDIKPYRDTMAAFERAASLSGDRSLSVISAAGGSGKTFCAQRFAQKHREHVLIRVPNRMLIEGTARKLLDIIAVHLGVQFSHCTSRLDVAAMVSIKLRNRGGMLMIDEADQLPTRFADLCRTLSMASGQPVCFIGTPSVEHILKDRKSTRLNSVTPISRMPSSA